MYQIIPLTPEHLAEIAVIERKSHAFPWSDAILASNFGARYFNYALIEEKQILGYYFASHVAGEASLLNIAVSPDAQGKGYGKALMIHLIKQCEALAQFQLWLEVRASNAHAYDLYLATGFNEVDRRIGYYPAKNGREDAIMMCYIV